MNENLDIRVEHGEPNSEELAAAVAVIQSMLASAAEEAADAAHLPNARSSWHRNNGLLRSPIQAGNGQWGAAIRAGLN